MNRVSAWLWGISLGAMASPALADTYTASSAGADADVAADASYDANADASLDDGQTITVTATRAPKDVNDAPATVTVISDQHIADNLATDIKDLVRFEPGISVPRQPARFGAALGTTGRAGNEGFNIRGIGGNRVLIQVDGVRIPDGFSFGAQGVGRGDYVDLGLVKSVEILRGPTSALYGSDGLAGAVSFITSDPADFIAPDKNVGGLLRAAYSSDDNEFAETAIIAGKSGNISAMIAYTRRDYNELKNRGSLGTANGTGSTRTRSNPQDGRADAFLARLSFEPGGGHIVRLTGEYIDTRLDTDVLSGRGAGLGGVVDSLTARDTGERKRITADWSWHGEGTVESARIAAYWQDAYDRQFTEELRTPAADRTRINTFENRVYGASADVRLGFDTGAITHRLVAGADVSLTRQKGLRDGTVPPASETYPTRAFPVTDYMLGGLFIGDEIGIADGRVTLYPALRWDRYVLDPAKDPLLPAFAASGSDGSKLTPKFGVVVKANNIIRLFGNYAKGFKAPAPSEVNQFFENLTSPYGAYRTIPAPDLRPETSESLEGGVRIVARHVTGSITVFKADYDDFISQEQVGGSGSTTDPVIYQFVNINAVKLHGLEAKVDVALPSGFTARAAMAYARGKAYRNDRFSGDLASIDPLTFVAGMGYDDPAGRFGGQLTLTHHSQKELGAVRAVCTATCYRPDPALILDLTARVRVTDAITVRGGVFNLLDKKYVTWADVRGLADTSATRDAFTRPGRNASASLSFRF